MFEPTLLLVSRGEAPLGIVYQTDAAADKGVKVLGTFPRQHPPARSFYSNRGGSSFDQSRGCAVHRLI